MSYRGESCQKFYRSFFSVGGKYGIRAKPLACRDDVTAEPFHAGIWIAGWAVIHVWSAIVKFKRWQWYRTFQFAQICPYRTYPLKYLNEHTYLLTCYLLITGSFWLAFQIRISNSDNSCRMGNYRWLSKLSKWPRSSLQNEEVVTGVQRSLFESNQYHSIWNVYGSFFSIALSRQRTAAETGLNCNVVGII